MVEINNHLSKFSLWALLNTVPSLRLDELKTISDSIYVSKLALDSRDVTKGALFFALNGAQTEGRKYIDQAIENGAVAILLDALDETNHSLIEHRSHNDHSTIIIHVYALTQYLSTIANHFYAYPSKKLAMVGVTGTNGKTTTTQLIAQWSKLLAKESAIIGTIGYGPYGKLTASNNTTPSAILVQQQLAEYVKADIPLCAIEVSSHGLVQHRVADVEFAVGAFLNLSRDHLDYHGDMANYEAAKWRLFSEHKVAEQVINIDDPIGFKWLQKLPNAIAVTLNEDALTLLNISKHRFVRLVNVEYHDKGANIEFASSWGAGSLKSQLLGEFNVSNLLIALGVLLSLNYPINDLVNTVQFLKPIEGRMEVFTTEGKPTLVVDYAHTPDALEKALKSARVHCHGTLWCVFGCGGDRDKGKRPLMGAIAEEFADQIVITDDNPRTEDHLAIVQDIMTGLVAFEPTRTKVINDRTAAIEYAFMNAKPDDVILIAGKGHEDYQIIGTVKHDYSDRLVAGRLLGVIA